MIYKVVATPNFHQNAKQLSKKFPFLKEELKKLSSELSHYPKMGTSLGKSVYKIRLAIQSKGKVKSGGGKSDYLCEGYCFYCLSGFDF